jgi:hypothetical protein
MHAFCCLCIIFWSYLKLILFCLNLTFNHCCTDLFFGEVKYYQSGTIIFYLLDLLELDLLNNGMCNSFFFVGDVMCNSDF